MSTYVRTSSGRFLGSLCSAEQPDQEQRASVPVVLDDSHVHAITDDLESRPHTAESAPAISSKSPAMVDKSPVNPAQDLETGDVPPVRSQPIPSHDDPVASPQGGAAKTPPRHPQSTSATSRMASPRQETSIRTDIPSVTVVGSTPVHRSVPESFGRLEEDRLPLTGRSSPVNDRDRRQSRRRSVMDVSLATIFLVQMGWHPSLRRLYRSIFC
jgi:hypothetical protein